MVIRLEHWKAELEKIGGKDRFPDWNLTGIHWRPVRTKTEMIQNSEFVHDSDTRRTSTEYTPLHTYVLHTPERRRSHQFAVISAMIDRAF